MVIQNTIKNKYFNWYVRFMSSRMTNPTESETVEKHHIIPSSLGGTDAATNIVRLTPREHFIAHRLLVKFTVGAAKRSMTWALHRMAFSNANVAVNARTYDRIRREFVVMVTQDGLARASNPAWVKEITTRVTNDWQNADQRRQDASNRMKRTWQEGKITKATSQKNGRHGLFGRLNHRVIAIEYKGVVYYGWRELREATKITKDLYQKYYMNGVDPTFRIGKNGPAPRGEECR